MRRRVPEVHGVAKLWEAMLRREQLRQHVVALGVIGTSEVEVAALERSRLLLEEEVVTRRRATRPPHRS